MSLKQTLFLDLKNAMKTKDTVLKDTIQMVRAGVLQQEKDNKIELDDSGVIDIIVKELKKCNDVLCDFEKSERRDLIDELNRKISILKSYLPEQLNNEELTNIILCAIQDTNATSMKDMKNVIALVKERTKDYFIDSKTTSDIIKNLLQNK